MQQRIDSLAQQVEHNTFNVGVLGSSPSWITREDRKEADATGGLLFFIPAPAIHLPRNSPI